MSNNSTSSGAELMVQCIRSSQWFGYSYLNQTLVTIVACLSLALGTSSTIANGLVLMAVYKTPSLRTMTNFFLTSLALADFIMGSLIVPLYFFGALNWPYHVNFPVFGMVLDFLIMQALICSSLNLCAISFDRHIAVKSSLLYPVIMTTRKCVVGIAVIWIASSGLAALSFMDARYEKRPTVYIIPGLSVPIPCIIFICYCYWHIIKVVIRQKKQIQAQSPSAFVDDDSVVVRAKGATNARLKKERKATLTVAMVVGTFVLCWLPNMLVSVIQFIVTEDYICNAFTFGEF